jgi:hypothetical protein
MLHAWDARPTPRRVAAMAKQRARQGPNLGRRLACGLIPSAVFPNDAARPSHQRAWPGHGGLDWAPPSNRRSRARRPAGAELFSCDPRWGCVFCALIPNHSAGRIPLSIGARTPCQSARGRKKKSQWTAESRVFLAFVVEREWARPENYSCASGSSLIGCRLVGFQPCDSTIAGRRVSGIEEKVKRKRLPSDVPRCQIGRRSAG